MKVLSGIHHGIRKRVVIHLIKFELMKLLARCITLQRTCGASNGRISKYRVEVSKDDQNWTEVSVGNWDNTDDWYIAMFNEPTEAKYVRLTGVETYGEGSQQNKFASAAEIRLRKADSKTDISDATVSLTNEKKLVSVVDKDHPVTLSKEDIEGALEQLKDSNHVVLSVNPLDVEAFHFNHKDRCYHCKRSIMSKVIAVAKEHDFAYVLDGKNKDDEKVYRPGLKACEELGIISPLANNNLAKQEIRDYSKQLGIATYNKPSNACLASRFDYNTELTLEKLKLVETGEKYLHDLGMLHVRLRVHGDVARLEV